MFLKKGDHLLISHRRMYESDDPRFFVGKVDDYDMGLVKVTGHSWYWSPVADLPQMKRDPITKIYALNSGTLITYFLPEELNLALIRFTREEDGRLTLSVPPNFELDLTEQSFRRSEEQ